MNRVELLKSDITEMDVDAVVNAANTSLLGGGGVDGAIHRKGGPAILEECKVIRARQGGCPPGEAVITTAGHMPAKHVIHTVGPIWSGGGSGERKILANAYKNSLKLATDNGLRTIAFPNISTGVYSFPKQEAAEIAISTVNEVLAQSPAIQKVYFVCFDDENFWIYQDLME